MSFGYFGFFQQPNTGVGVTGGALARTFLNSIIPGGAPGDTVLSKYIATDIQYSGLIADFNWYYPYAFTIIPFEIINVAVQITTESAVPYVAFYTDTDSGVFNTKINTNLTGKIQGNNDFAYLNSNFHGYFFGQDTVFAYANNQISGKIKQSPFDYASSNTSMSGRVADSYTDYGNTNVFVSGKIGAENDFSNLSSYFSGKINQAQFDSGSINTNFHGNFMRVSSDDSYLDFSITSLQRNINRTIKFSSSGDSASVAFGITNYQIDLNV